MEDKAGGGSRDGGGGSSSGLLGSRGLGSWGVGEWGGVPAFAAVINYQVDSDFGCFGAPTLHSRYLCATSQVPPFRCSLVHLSITRDFLQETGVPVAGVESQRVAEVEAEVLCCAVLSGPVVWAQVAWCRRDREWNLQVRPGPPALPSGPSLLQYYLLLCPSVSVRIPKLHVRRRAIGSRPADPSSGQLLPVSILNGGTLVQRG